MNVKILDKSDRKMRFQIDGTTPAFANILRRTMLNGIPTMAIETVNFEINNGALFDEILAHRLGLLPLTFADTYVTKDRCKCEGKGCISCEVVLVLEKQGPCVVKASDLKSTDESVVCSEPEIPIVELLDGQELKLEAKAELGFGTEHSKWQGAVVGYRPSPVIKVKDCKNAKEVADVCPKKVFDVSGGLKAARVNDCNLCLRCAEICKGGVDVSTDESSFLFDIESVCGLKAIDVLKNALDEMELKSNEFKKEVQNLK